MSSKKCVLLRPLMEKDAANIVRWRNKNEVRNNLFTQDLLTEEQHQKYYENVVLPGKCRQYIIVAIETESRSDIGTIFIKNIDFKSGNGEMGIFIGEDSFRGRGFAGPAIEAILNIAFSEIRLECVTLSVIADNEAAIHVYEKAGFIKEKILPAAFARSTGKVDIVEMKITRDIWKTVTGGIA